MRSVKLGKESNTRHIFKAKSWGEVRLRRNRSNKLGMILRMADIVGKMEKSMTIIWISGRAMFKLNTARLGL